MQAPLPHPPPNPVSSQKAVFITRILWRKQVKGSICMFLCVAQAEVRVIKDSHIFLNGDLSLWRTQKHWRLRNWSIEEGVAAASFHHLKIDLTYLGSRVDQVWPQDDYWQGSLPGALWQASWQHPPPPFLCSPPLPIPFEINFILSVSAVHLSVCLSQAVVHLSARVLGCQSA